MNRPRQKSQLAKVKLKHITCITTKLQIRHKLQFSPVKCGRKRHQRTKLVNKAARPRNPCPICDGILKIVIHADNFALFGARAGWPSSHSNNCYSPLTERSLSAPTFGNRWVFFEEDQTLDTGKFFVYPTTQIFWTLLCQCTFSITMFRKKVWYTIMGKKLSVAISKTLTALTNERVGRMTRDISRFVHTPAHTLDVHWSSPLSSNHAQTHSSI